MKEWQDKIQKFNDDRDWSRPGSIKDLLLNMNEEIGEFWNIIKWVGPEKQAELIEKHKDEVQDFIGDMVYLVLKVSYLCGVSAEEGIKAVMSEYEGRFPVETTKGNHANTRAGGVDGKQQE